MHERAGVEHVTRRVASPGPNPDTVLALRAAVLHEHGATPRVHEFDDPREQSSCALVDVRAAGLHHLDLHKASGSFCTGPPPLPGVVGTDGVGRPQDGTRVCFDESVPPYCSMAERTLDEVADARERRRQAAGGPKMVLVP